MQQVDPPRGDELGNQSGDRSAGGAVRWDQNEVQGKVNGQPEACPLQGQMFEAARDQPDTAEGSESYQSDGKSKPPQWLGSTNIGLPEEDQDHLLGEEPEQGERNPAEGRCRPQPIQQLGFAVPRTGCGGNAARGGLCQDQYQPEAHFVDLYGNGIVPCRYRACHLHQHDLVETLIADYRQRGDYQR